MDDTHSLELSHEVASLGARLVERLTSCDHDKSTQGLWRIQQVWDGWGAACEPVTHSRWTAVLNQQSDESTAHGGSGPQRL